MQQRLFLLGGMDLEMQAIEELLKQQGERFINKGLSWGAKLSSYEQELQEHPDIIIYGIELSEDITPPSNYYHIDHHNELSHLPSSIEQVAVLLNVSLNREQQLIAANDSKYIPGMLALGASDKEIQTIRMLDRKAQGVTSEDEKLGEESIRQMEWQGDVIVVRALTDRFSTITDRLYGKSDKLIVYNSGKLVYYGPGIDILADRLQHWLPEKAYYGGGASGYFGVKDNVFSETDIKQTVLPTILKHVSQ